MIRIIKTSEPAVLASNAAAWTKTLVDHEAAGTRASEAELNRYNHSDIKNALKEETHHKCAYCESHFDHVDYGDIEHIVPKKKSHTLRFDWLNLTLACGRCNTGKGLREDIIDPYVDDPSTAFVFCGPAILPLFHRIQLQS